MSAGSQDYTTGAGRSHLKDDLIVALRERNDLAAENAELREERALIIQRAENAEAALVAEVAKNGRHAMRVTIAQLEARLQKVMARCADLLDEDQFNELDAIASSASWERDATYAQLAEAQRFPHGAAAVTGCDMKINDEGRSNAAHWHERAMKAEARLADAERERDEAVALLRYVCSLHPDDCECSGCKYAFLAKLEDKHTDECWEPDSGCDMGRNEKYVKVLKP